MPQGSSLGPLSFLVLIGDLEFGCLAHKYVDDTTLTELIRDKTKPSNMQTIFEQLLTWTNENHMAVNYSKTKEIIMGSSSITANVSLIKTTTGHIERVDSTKLLGIHLDSNFSWQPHIEAILAKATHRLYFLKQLTRAGVPHSQLRHFYLTVIRPVLEYASPVWHHLITKKQLEQIEAIQKRVIRMIYPCAHNMPYISAELLADLPTMSDRRVQLAKIIQIHNPVYILLP